MNKTLISCFLQFATFYLLHVVLYYPMKIKKTHHYCYKKASGFSSNVVIHKLEELKYYLFSQQNKRTVVYSKDYITSRGTHRGHVDDIFLTISHHDTTLEREVEYFPNRPRIFHFKFLNFSYTSKLQLFY